MTRHSLILKTFAAVLSLGLVACSGTGSQPSAPAATKTDAPKVAVPGVTDSEILIGTFVPLSGPAAIWGDVSRGLEAYAKYTNDQGGVHGRKLKILVEDDQYQPSRTVAATKKLVEQDKVFAIAGVCCTPSLAAVQDYLTQNKVPAVASMAPAVRFQQPHNPFLFAGMMPYFTEGRIQVRFAVEDLKLKKLAGFHINNDAGQETMDGVKEAAKAMGAEVLVTVGHDNADVDYSAYALKLKASGAEAVLVMTNSKPVGQLIREAEKIDYRPTWILNTAAFTSDLLPSLERFKDVKAYIVSQIPDLAETNNPAVKQFVEQGVKYRTGAGTPAQLLGWHAGMVLVEGLKQAGKDLTRENLMKALETMKEFPGIFKVTYTDKSHQPNTRASIRQVKDGKYIIIKDGVSG